MIFIQHKFLRKQYRLGYKTYWKLNYCISSQLKYFMSPICTKNRKWSSPTFIWSSPVQLFKVKVNHSSNNLNSFESVFRVRESRWWESQQNKLMIIRILMYFGNNPLFYFPNRIYTRMSEHINSGENWLHPGSNSNKGLRTLY